MKINLKINMYIYDLYFKTISDIEIHRHLLAIAE